MQIYIPDLDALIPLKALLRTDEEFEKMRTIIDRIIHAFLQLSNMETNEDERVAKSKNSSFIIYHIAISA